MEIGLYSFGERTIDPESGQLIISQERMRRLLEEIQLADEVGLDVFGLGEHHRPDYIISAPAVRRALSVPSPSESIRHTISRKSMGSCLSCEQRYTCRG